MTSSPRPPAFRITRLVACLAAGCAGGAPEQANPPEGGPQRLVTWRLESEGTRPLVLGIHDRELDARCSFAIASDGAWRCLPLALTPANGWFADSDCRPLLTWTPPVHAPGARPPEMTAVALPRVAECGPSVREVRRTVPLTGRSFFRMHGDGACRPADDKPTDQGIFLTTGELVPPSRFAEGKLVARSPVPGDRLGVEQIESASGGPFAVGIHDTRWGRTCNLESDLTCWPEHARTGEFFADGRCTTPLTSFDRCAHPVLARQDKRASRIGPAWTSEVWWAPKKMCPSGPVQPWRQTYAVGEALEADAIASLACAPQGTGRLKVNLATTAAGAVLEHQGCDRSLTWSYADAHAGTTCHPRRTPDGTIRCLPHQAQPPFYFADPGCAHPLVACDDHCDQGVLLPGPGDDIVPGASALRAVGARFTGSQVFVSISAGQCLPVPTSGFPSLWELGSPADWTRYPALSEWRGTERLGP